MDQPPPLQSNCAPEQKTDSRTDKFELNPASIILIVIALGLGTIAAYLGSREFGNPSKTIGYFVGSWIGILLFTFIPGWLAWRLSGRRKGAGNLVFIIMASLTILGQSARVYASWRTHQNTRPGEALVQEDGVYRGPSFAVLDQHPYSQGSTQDETAAVILPQGQDNRQASADREAAMAQAATDFKREFKEKVTAFTQANRRFNEGVSVDPTHYQSQKEIAKARELAKAYEAASRDVLNLFENLESTIIAKFEAVGLSVQDGQQAYEEVRAGMRDIWKDLTRIYRLNTEYAATTDQLLVLLQDHWGQWKYDAVTAEFTFDNPAMDTDYYRLLERLIVMEEMAVQAQQQLAQKR